MNNNLLSIAFRKKNITAGPNKTLSFNENIWKELKQVIFISKTGIKIDLIKKNNLLKEIEYDLDVVHYVEMFRVSLRCRWLWWWCSETVIVL